MDLKKTPQKQPHRRRLNDSVITESIVSKKSHKSASHKKRFYKKTWFKVVSVAILILVLLLGGLGFYSVGPAQAAYASALAGRESVMNVQQALLEQDFDLAEKSIVEAQNHFEDAKDNINQLSWASYVPIASRQYHAVDDMIDGTLLALEAGVVGLAAGEVILEPVFGNEGAGTFNDFTSEEKGEILAKIDTVQPELEKTLLLLEDAQSKFEEIPDFGVLPQISEAKNMVNDQLPDIVDLLSEGVAFSKFLPALAGYPEEQSYFLLFQNNTELRPSGGFLGSYGEVKVDNAEIVSFITKDVYSLDEASDISVEPPWQIKKLAAPFNKTWYMRDSNWSPDFEVAANNVRDFYELEGGTEDFDGVIGITPDFVGDLLEITGPTKVPGLPYTFTKENFTETVEFHVEKNFVNNGIDFHERKDILSDLSQILIGEILTLPKEEWPHLYEIAQRALMEKHIVVYFDNKEAQKFAMSEKWAGRVLDTQGDYIMVVDSNMASLKTDEFIERTFSYTLDARGDAPQAKLRLNYKNAAPGFTWKTTRYRNYNRVYLNQGSRFISVSGNETGAEFYQNSEMPYEVVEDLGKQTFGTFVSIEPQEERAIEYTYEVPENVVSGDQYRLYVQKQIGTIAPTFNARLFFDKKIDTVGPQEFVKKISDTEVEITSNLLVDREFIVTFK